MAAHSEIPLSSLQVGETFTTGKGAKQIPLTVGGDAVLWQPKQWLSIPWEPSAFNNPEATRVNLVFHGTPAILDSLRALDEWSISTLSEKSEALFGQVISKEEMERRFQPTVKTHEASGMQSWRVKMNTTGRGATRLWDSFHNSMPSPPESWTTCSAKARVRVKGFWLMAKEVGVILEAVDVMLDAQGAECPFE